MMIPTSQVSDPADVRKMEAINTATITKWAKHDLHGKHPILRRAQNRLLLCLAGNCIIEDDVEEKGIVQGSPNCSTRWKELRNTGSPHNPRVDTMETGRLHSTTRGLEIATGGSTA